MGDGATFQAAYKLHTLGYAIVPSGAGEKGKYPLIKWTEYQRRPPTEEEFLEWEDCHHPSLWGAVTGEVSRIVVFDADSVEVQSILEENGLRPHVLTPKPGAHFWFRHPGYHVPTKAKILPGLDVRGEGGFCNVVGTRPDGGKYRIVMMPLPDTLYSWDQLPEEVRHALGNGHKPASEREAGPILEGRRNATLASLAGSMRRRGMSVGSMKAALVVVNAEQCKPPLHEDDVNRIAESVGRYPPSNAYSSSGQSPSSATRVSTSGIDDPGSNRAKFGQKVVHPNMPDAESSARSPNVLAQRVRAWVESTSGAWWGVDELDRDLSISSRMKDYRGQVLRRLKDQGIVEQHPRINKHWRYVNTKVTSLLFKQATSQGIMPVQWPFSIEGKVNLYPGNLAVVAGSPNAGKTAFLLDFIRRNQERFSIYYFCSEMGEVELKDRLEKFPGMAIDDWHFEAFERASDFADVIRPGCINVIDFLEMTENLYMVNTYLTDISHKLGDGLAIVALQKKDGARLGRGQEFSLEKPKLYLTMDKGELTIVKGKSWATKNVDPNGLQIYFKIHEGCQFQVTGDWHRAK